MATIDRPRVLVIDDEEGPRQSLRIILKEQFDVLLAANVDEGVRLLQDVGADTVVIDIRMPGTNGIEGLARIRGIDRLISVIVLTGYGTLETAQQALRLGATDYITKPFDAHEMVRVVRRNVERTRRERQKLRLIAELRELNRRTVEEKARLEKLARLGEASAELLHDLKNPLTTIIGYTEMLAEELERMSQTDSGDWEEALRYLQIIENNVRRCRDLAAMWREGESTRRREKIHPAELLEDIRAAVNFVQVGAPPHPVFETEESVPHIIGDRGQLLRAIHNVVSNAIQAASTTAGEVKVTTRKVDGEVEICVEDTGPGMTPDVMQRLFEPYFTTRAAGGGMGLGMSITRKIVEQHSGRIEVDSRPNQGTRVRLIFPAAPGAEEEAEESQ